MTGTSLIACALRNTSKGKLIYKRNLDDFENEVSFKTKQDELKAKFHLIIINLFTF